MSEPSIAVLSTCPHATWTGFLVFLPPTVANLASLEINFPRAKCRGERSLENAHAQSCRADPETVYCNARVVNRVNSLTVCQPPAEMRR